LLRNAKTFRLLFIKFLIIGFFANSLLPQACFCGEACSNGLQGKTKVGLSFLFHSRCPGNQCKSCNFEDLQTLKISNTAHLTPELKTFNAQFILFNFSDCQSNINFISIFFYHFNQYVKVQSLPVYLQNLSLLL
jgi:hypothetical protein